MGESVATHDRVTTESDSTSLEVLLIVTFGSILFEELVSKRTFKTIYVGNFDRISVEVVNRRRNL